MKKLAIYAVMFCLCIGIAHAADQAAAPTTQQSALLDAVLGWAFAHLGSFVHNMNARLNTKSPAAAEIADIAEKAAVKALTAALQAQAK